MSTPSIAFSPLKGPHIGGGGQLTSHIEAYNAAELVVQTTTVVIATSAWTSLYPETLKAGFSVEGISSVACNVRVEITRNDVVVMDWLNAMPAGPHTHYGPLAIHNQPQGSATWGLQARCDAGTFTIAAGQGRFFIARKVRP